MNPGLLDLAWIFCWAFSCWGWVKHFDEINLGIIIGALIFAPVTAIIWGATAINFKFKKNNS